MTIDDSLYPFLQMTVHFKCIITSRILCNLALNKKKMSETVRNDVKKSDLIYSRT